MSPHFKGFEPEGLTRNKNSYVSINYEEYEALKLCDYEFYTQAEAAEFMNISRPTFTRIYESVRRKIAKAFLEGNCIRFEGGDIFYSSWYKCDYCKITFTLSDIKKPNCPFCKSQNINEIN